MKPGDEITHVEMWSAFELPIKSVTTEDEALLLFGEHLNLYQWIGVSVAIVSFLLLGKSGKRELLCALKPFLSAHRCENIDRIFYSHHCRDIINAPDDYRKILESRFGGKALICEDGDIAKI